MGLFSVGARDRFFAGKHVLVTGGSSGIGKEAARIAAAAGASVTLVARTESTLAAAAADIGPPGESDAAARRVNIAVADCSDPRAVEKMVEEVERAFGPVDVLVNCAGGAQGGYFDEFDCAVFKEQMDKNYFSQLYPTHAFFKRMAARRRGRIVLISSISGQVGVFGLAAYAPPKYALRGLAEVLFYEARPFGVGITIVFPPDTDTPGNAQEQFSMPPETLAVTGDAGLFSAPAVAERLISGLVRGDFRVCVGMEGEMVGILTAGLSPCTSLIDIVVIPFMRALSRFYVWSWNRVVLRGHHVRFPQLERTTTAN